MRVLIEGGVQLDAIRQFWTVEDIAVVDEGHSAGDLFAYEGERWRARATGRWGGFSDTIAVRQEGQG